MNIEINKQDKGRLLANASFTSLLAGNKILTARDLWAMQSVGVKNAVRTRGTARALLHDPDGGSDVEVYIKRYQKPTIKDRIKCLTSLKPVFTDGALHEWRALCRFHAMGLNTMVPIAAADCGNGRTCNLTLGITDYIRASDLFADDEFDDQERRKGIIRQIAELLGKMHAAGMAHQDFYLVHLFVKPQENDSVYLIDLQRTIIQPQLSRRWQIKDLAQFEYSSAPYFSQNEKTTFRKTYLQSFGGVPDDALFRAAEQKAAGINRHSTKHAL